MINSALRTAVEHFALHQPDTATPEVRTLHPNRALRPRCRADDSSALVVLAEHLGEPRARDLLDVGQIPQDPAGPDTRQLIGVTDEQQVTAVPHLGGKTASEGQVEHGRLVDDHQIGHLQHARMIEERVALGRPDQPGAPSSPPAHRSPPDASPPFPSVGAASAITAPACSATSTRVRSV